MIKCLILSATLVIPSMRPTPLVPTSIPLSIEVSETLAAPLSSTSWRRAGCGCGCVCGSVCSGCCLFLPKCWVMKSRPVFSPPTMLVARSIPFSIDCREMPLPFFAPGVVVFTDEVEVPAGLRASRGADRAGEAAAMRARARRVEGCISRSSTKMESRRV
ncbi:hypothetical protein BDY19DRAFT_945098, partial [Irpex rosettiformis]